MRVFQVLDPSGLASSLHECEPPTHPLLDTVVLSSNAYVLATPTESYKEFCLYAQQHLTRTITSYIGGSSSTTTFYQRVRIDGKVYMKVPLFFPQLCQFQAKTWIDKRRTPTLLRPALRVRPGFALYDYQEKVSSFVLPQLKSTPYYSGVLHAVCGAGKTGMTCFFMAQLNVRTVIFVNTDHLMNQWVGELKAWLGLDEVDDIGYISGKHKPPTRPYPVLLCMLQSIRKGSKYEALVREQIQHYDLLVSDECHHMPADTYYETMSYFKGRHRLALSATLERSDDMIRLVPYLFGPVTCRAVEDLLGSTYVKCLHPLYYTNADHSDKLWLPQWNKHSKPKINYGGMLSRLGNDLTRIRLAVQYTLQAFPGERVLYLAKLRCQSEYAAAYIQFREHAIFCYALMLGKLNLPLSQKTVADIARWSHYISDLEAAAIKREQDRLNPPKKSKHKRKQPARKKKSQKAVQHSDGRTQVFLYMGGGAGSRKKREYRDVMLEKATYLSCTAAIAGEAFNIRGVNRLCILWPQKPNGLLEQMEGRVKRGKHVDRVEVVTVVDKSLDTFEKTGMSQIRWFRNQRYLVYKPCHLDVDMAQCPPPNPRLDAKSVKAQKRWAQLKAGALRTGTPLTLDQVYVEDDDDEEAAPESGNEPQLMASLGLTM